jgi:hypothetical protein
MPATTAQQLITNACVTIGRSAPGTALPAGESSAALRRLNLMIGGWSLQPLTQNVVTREVFTLTADKGGPDNPYTIGVGGNFNTTRPVGLNGAGIIIPATDPLQNVEVPRAVLTDDAWQAIQIKGLRSTQFTDVYFNATFADDLGTINLWPVPDSSVYSLVIYRQQQLPLFPSLVAEVFLPPGAEDAIEYNLARRLLTAYGITDQGTVSDVIDLATSSLATFKRGNTKLADLGTDPALTHSQRGGYNILTGQPSGA